MLMSKLVWFEIDDLLLELLDDDESEYELEDEFVFACSRSLLSMYTIGSLGFV